MQDGTSSASINNEMKKKQFSRNRFIAQPGQNQVTCSCQKARVKLVSKQMGCQECQRVTSM